MALKIGSGPLRLGGGGGLQIKGSSGFTPSSIAGLVAWWRADDIAGNDGDTITTWTDRIAHIAATSGTGPTLKKTTNGIGGKNVARFTGTQWLQAATAALPAQGPFTVYAVCKPTAAPTDQMLLTYDLPSFTNKGWGVGLHQTNPKATTWAVKDYVSAYTTTTSSPHILSWVMNSSQGIEFDKNYLYTEDIVTGTTNANAGATTVSIGRRGGNSDLFAQADIAEILIFSNKVSAANQRNLAYYLYDYYNSGSTGVAPTGNRLNASAALTTPSYDTSNTLVEHSMIYTSAGLFGHKYWMAYVPYPSQNNAFENPSLLVSDDGTTWSVPGGVTNPIVPARAVNNGNNSDPSLLLAQDGKFYMYHCVENSLTTTDNGVWVLSSTDGITWSAAAKCFQGNSGAVMEPKVIWTGSQYVMLTVNSVLVPNRLQYRTCSTPNGTWSAAADCSLTMPNSATPWHTGDIMVVNGYYVLGVSDSGTVGGSLHRNLWLTKSTDLINWTCATRPVIVPSVSGWDSSQGYRLCLPSNDGTNFDAFYSAASGTVWHLGRTSIPLTELP